MAKAPIPQALEVQWGLGEREGCGREVLGSPLGSSLELRPEFD